MGGSRGQVYLLQPRPITTMQPYNPATGEWNDSLRGNYLWTNANFGEAVPDVMTPMTWSLLQIYGREAFTIPLPGWHPLFGNISARFYMNASLAASMFHALGYSQSRTQIQMREFFGYLPENVTLSLIPFLRWTVLRALLKSAPPGRAGAGTSATARRNPGDGDDEYWLDAPFPQSERGHHRCGRAAVPCRHCRPRTGHSGGGGHGQCPRAIANG